MLSADCYSIISVPATTSTPAGGTKRNCCVCYFDVFLLLKKAEFGHRAIQFLDHNALDQAVGCDFQQSLLNPVAHAFGNSSQHHVAGFSGF